MKKSTKIIISAVLVALTSGFFYNEWSNEISDKVIYNGKELNNPDYDDWREVIKKPNGILKEYLNSGELSREEIWKDGELTSQITYDKNGRIQINYKNGENVYEVIHDKNGILVREVIYKDSNKNYIDKWYVNGKLFSEETYKDSKIISEVFYHEDGSKVQFPN